MKLKKATIEELKNLKPGTIVVTDLNEHVSDFSIFESFDETTNTATVYDCMFKSSIKGDDIYFKNVSNYKDIAIIDIKELFREDL